MASGRRNRFTVSVPFLSSVANASPRTMPDAAGPDLDLYVLANPVLAVPIRLLDGGPNQPGYGRAMIAADPADDDLVLDHNHQYFAVRRPQTTYAPPVDGNANVYHLDETVPLRSGETGNVVFKIANVGKNPTKKSMTVTLSSPFYVNFGDLKPLEQDFGAKKLYENPEPAVPEVARFTMPAGLSAGAVASPTRHRTGTTPR